MTATRRPMGPCPLPECHGAEHVHISRGAPHRWGEPEATVRFDGRDPAAAVEIVTKPKRGAERRLGAWSDPAEAASWFERTAREIRAAYVETVPTISAAP